MHNKEEKNSFCSPVWHFPCNFSLCWLWIFWFWTIQGLRKPRIPILQSSFAGTIFIKPSKTMDFLWTVPEFCCSYCCRTIVLLPEALTSYQQRQEIPFWFCLLFVLILFDPISAAVPNLKIHISIASSIFAAVVEIYKCADHSEVVTVGLEIKFAGKIDDGVCIAILSETSHGRMHSAELACRTGNLNKQTKSVQERNARLFIDMKQ